MYVPQEIMNLRFFLTPSRVFGIFFSHNNVLKRYVYTAKQITFQLQVIRKQWMKIMGEGGHFDPPSRCPRVITCIAESNCGKHIRILKKATYFLYLKKKGLKL